MKYLFLPVLVLMCQNVNAAIPHMHHSHLPKFAQGECIQEINPDLEDWDYRPTYKILQVGRHKYLLEDEMYRHTTIEIDSENDFVRVSCGKRQRL